MATFQFTLQPKTPTLPTPTKPKIQHHPTPKILSFPTPFSFTLPLTTPTSRTPLNVSPLRATSSYDNADFSPKTATNTSSNNGVSTDSLMLPGCDFKHWLIVMDFPKDPSPTREQMIQTYLDTLASVLGSMEEAKKNMYAFSTTTYTGFQCTVDEETSEKFKGLPGVLWVLPDSYIDVKNKDYGGDKYINGEIIPCKYPTYQPKQRNTSKYESRRYERRRDGPPRSTTTRRPRQETTPSESASS